MSDLNSLRSILTIIMVIIIILIFILLIVYLSSKSKKVKKEKNRNNSVEAKDNTIKSKTFAVESVMDFMEFDKIADNMIMTKNGIKYIMVIECQGINYDLMSAVEKNSVEEGFIQFLNTIRYPIQIYVQTRTINLESSLQTYKDKLKEIEDNFQKQEIKYREMRSSGNYTKEEMDKVYYELTKQRNLTEYGKDIIYTTEKMSLNKNVLNQKYYVIVPYYPEELGQNDFDKEEIQNLAFSELYTRCQSIIATLAGCEVLGKILNSNELAELLYVAYNRDEQEVYGLEKALNARFDELYSTAPDVLDKKMETLNRKIEEEAFNKASQKVQEAQSAKERALKRKENNMDNLIDNLAKLIVEKNAQAVGYDVAQEAIKSIENDKKIKESEGGTEDNVKEKTKRRTTTKTA